MSSTSKILDDMQLATSLARSIIKAVENAGGTDEDVQFFTTPYSSDTWRDIDKVIDNAVKSLKKMFVLTVDYGRPLEDSIKAGGYDTVEDGINDYIFPRTDDEWGKVERTFKFYDYDSELTDEEIIRDINQNGYNPATVREFLRFGEANPEIQKHFPIIALGSISRKGGKVATYSDSNKRRLVIDSSNPRNSNQCRFLAVKKRIYVIE